MAFDAHADNSELVPSSARSVSSAASSLPAQLIPLLHDSLDKVKDAIAKVLPVNKKRTVLEEAEWEDESSEGALERELLMQCKLLPFPGCFDLIKPYSYGNTPCVSPSGGAARSCRDGSGLRCRCGAAPSGRVQCAKP